MMVAMAEDEDVEAWLDSLDPATHPARDAVHFRRIIAACDWLKAAEAELVDAIRAARAAGDSEVVIRMALDGTKIPDAARADDPEA